MSVGLNTEAGQALTSYVERVERLRAEKKQVGEQETAVLAEAKSRGFVPAAIRAVVKIRAMKPHARQEAEAILDTYLHALGMAADTPLFRQVGLMKVDKAARDEVVEALKLLVPDGGSITVEAGGKPIKLTRDKGGEVIVTEVVPFVSPATSGGFEASGVAREEPPPVDAGGAEALGGEAFRANTPIIANPFPFGDPRRARWDVGWRKAGGGDGMGPG